NRRIAVGAAGHRNKSASLRIALPTYIGHFPTGGWIDVLIRFAQHPQHVDWGPGNTELGGTLADDDGMAGFYRWALPLRKRLIPCDSPLGEFELDTTSDPVADANRGEFL